MYTSLSDQCRHYAANVIGKQQIARQVCRNYVSYESYE